MQKERNQTFVPAWVATASAQAFLVGVSALTTILIARALGPAYFGEYSFYLVATSLLPVVAGLGTEHGFILKSSREPALLATAFAASFKVRLIASSLLAFLWVLFVGFVWTENLVAMGIIGVSALVGGLNNPLFLALYRVRDLHLRAWAILILPAVGLLIIVALRGADLTITYIAGASLVSTIISTALFIAAEPIARRELLSVRTKSLQSESVPHLVNQTLDILANRIDMFGLNNVLDSGSFGLYAAAQRIVGLFTIIPSSIHSVTLSRIHRLASHSADQYELFRRIRRFLSFSLGLVVILLSLFGTQLTTLLLGRNYNISASLLALVSCGLYLYGVGFAYHMYAEAIGDIKGRTIARLASLIGGLAAIAFVAISEKNSFAPLVYVSVHFVYLAYIEIARIRRLSDALSDMAIAIVSTGFMQLVSNTRLYIEANLLLKSAIFTLVAIAAFAIYLLQESKFATSKHHQ